MDKHILTLANSIIGVSILAMPYCFKQCGILLAIIILLFSNLITRLTSHFLIKSAIIARKRTFEFLAYYIFGGLGKFAIEVGIIGFLIGTCIAFFVVMGDLGPEIISEITGRNTSSAMRSSILMALALFCVLPLGLLRNIDSLSGVSRATIGFYFCLVLKIVVEALPHLFSGDWTNKVELWRPAGVIQCLPIFSMALSCQTQLFEIYQVVHNPTLEKMNYIVKNAVNICTLVYFLVGFFGYIAFARHNFSGNILISFAPSLLTNVIKLGFILSIAFSFPLVIFPCRASIHSLIYREGFSLHEGTSNYIPEGRFKTLTFIIVFVSLIVGILIPNIELVLGLVGSTIGIMICILFPVICFIYISQKNTNERLLAKLVLAVGFVLMVLGTYENLHGLENIKSSPVVQNLVTEHRELKIIDPAAKDPVKDIKAQTVVTGILDFNKINNKIKKDNQTKIQTLEKVMDSSEIRHEPPQPVEPQDSQPIPEKLEVELKPNLNEKEAKESFGNNENVKINNNIEENNVQHIDAGGEKPPKQVVPLDSLLKKNQNIVPEKRLEEKSRQILDGNQNVKPNDTRNDQVDIEAIKKDDQETQLQQKEDPHLEEHKYLIDTIQKQNEVQEEIVKQQKKLIEVIEKQQDQKAKEEKLKAVKEIESIALQAIEKISGDVDNNERVVAELENDVIQKVNFNENVQESKAEKHDVVVKKEKSNLDDFKIVNGILNNKIKQNNITTKKSLVDIKENVPFDADYNKKISPNLTIDANPKNDISLNNKTNTFNNTAPLFLNLGPKSNGDSIKESIIAIAPLPVVSNVKLPNSTKKSNKSSGELEKSLDKNNNGVLDEEAKVMRRDILAYKIAKRRR